MTDDHLRARVRDVLPGVRRDLEALVRIESVSADPARVGEVQRISLANTWLRTPVNPDWLFCYDACAVPLVEPGPLLVTEMV